MFINVFLYTSSNETFWFCSFSYIISVENSLTEEGNQLMAASICC